MRDSHFKLDLAPRVPRGLRAPRGRVAWTWSWKPLVVLGVLSLLPVAAARAQSAAPGDSQNLLRIPPAELPVQPAKSVQAAEQEQQVEPLASPPGQPASRTTDLAQFSFSERLLNEIVGQPEVDQGPVRERILGADVRGHQQTQLVTSLDVKPSPNGLHIEFLADATMQSETVGATSQAAIGSTSQFQMQLQKPCWFDGQRWLTHTPVGRVQPSSQLHWSTTPYAQIPLIGDIANRVAFDAARFQQRAADAEAAGKAWDSVAPRFNRRIDDLIGKLTPEAISSQVPGAKQLAANWRLHSTERFVHIRAISSDAQALTGDSLPDPNRDLVLEVSDSFLNGWLTQDGQQGLKISDAELEHRTDRLRRAFEQDLSLESLQAAITSTEEPLPARLAEFEFDPIQPVAVTFREAQIVVQLRFTLQPLVGEPLPGQIIEIPLKLQSDAGQSTLVPGPVRVFREPDSGEPLATESLTQTLIQQRISAQLRPVPLPETISLRDTVAHLKRPLIRRQWVIGSGRMRMEFDLQPRPVGQPDAHPTAAAPNDPRLAESGPVLLAPQTGQTQAASRPVPIPEGQQTQYLRSRPEAHLRSSAEPPDAQWNAQPWHAQPAMPGWKSPFAGPYGQAPYGAARMEFHPPAIVFPDGRVIIAPQRIPLRGAMRPLPERLP